MAEADAPLEPPLLAAQALLLTERGKDLLVINPGATGGSALRALTRSQPAQPRLRASLV
jgi:hypothetical protein